MFVLTFVPILAPCPPMSQGSTRRRRPSPGAGRTVRGRVRSRWRSISAGRERLKLRDRIEVAWLISLLLLFVPLRECNLYHYHRDRGI